MLPVNYQELKEASEKIDCWHYMRVKAGDFTYKPYPPKCIKDEQAEKIRIDQIIKDFVRRMN